VRPVTPGEGEGDGRWPEEARRTAGRGGSQTKKVGPSPRLGRAAYRDGASPDRGIEGNPRSDPRVARPARGRGVNEESSGTGPSSLRLHRERTRIVPAGVETKADFRRSQRPARRRPRNEETGIEGALNDASTGRLRFGGDSRIGTPSGQDGPQHCHVEWLGQEVIKPDFASGQPHSAGVVPGRGD
jgi:hypothetical protein